MRELVAAIIFAAVLVFLAVYWASEHQAIYAMPMVQAARADLSAFRGASVREDELLAEDSVRLGVHNSAHVHWADHQFGALLVGSDAAPKDLTAFEAVGVRPARYDPVHSCAGNYARSIWHRHAVFGFEAERPIELESSGRTFRERYQVFSHTDLPSMKPRS